MTQTEATVTVEQRHIAAVARLKLHSTPLDEAPTHELAEHFARFDTTRTAELEREIAALRDQLAASREAIEQLDDCEILQPLRWENAIRFGEGVK